MTNAADTHLADVGLTELPDGWDVVEIESLLSQDRGISVGVMYPGNHDPEGIPLIKVGDLTSNNINPCPEFRITPEKHHEYRRTQFEGGELLVTLVGALGHCAIVPESMKGWNAARAIAVIRFKNPEDAEFVRVCLLSPPLKRLMYVWANTSVQATINLKEIKQLPIPFPTAKERQQIIEVISCLDRKIENLRQQNETLEAIAQTLFKHWFVDFEFPNAHGKPYKSSGGAMKPSELGEIPVGWRVGKLGDFCTIFRGSSPRPITSPVFFKNGTIPWIKIADATKSNSIYLSETKELCTEAALPHTRFLKKGSLILSNSATVGIPMILNLDGCIHDGWLSFKDYKIISRNFLFFVLVNKLKFLTKYADGTVQKNLNTGILKNMNFIVADENIIGEFTVIVQTIFDKILVNEQQIQTLTQTRDVLLPKLMSGQLRIT